jgi:outer membrane protein assembly factor BamB
MPGVPVLNERILKANRIKLPLLLAIMLVVTVMVIPACIGGARGSIARGWAGGLVIDNTVIVGSMEGKIITLNATDGSRLGSPALLEAQIPSGGFFGCTPGGTSAVPVYGSPVVHENLAYVGGYDGKVRAFEFSDEGLTGEPEYDYPREGGIGANIIGGLAKDEAGQIFFGSDAGDVYALDSKLRTVWIWSAEKRERFWSTPVVENGTLYIGGFSGKVYALDILATNDTERLKWTLETGGTIISSLVVDNGRVYVGSFDRIFYALDATSGEEIWRFPASDDEADTPDGWFWAKPIVHNGIVYAPNLDGKVYALDANSGMRLTEFDLGSPVSSSPVLVNDTIVVAASTTNRTKKDGTVYGLDTTTNQQRLLEDLGENVYAPLFASDSTVYVHTMSNNLFAINIETGSSQKFDLDNKDSE